MLILKLMPNQEQYHLEKQYRALWMMPQASRVVLLKIQRTRGVVLEIGRRPGEIRSQDRWDKIAPYGVHGDQRRNLLL